ncbi:DUF2591 family protein [Serratia fonticola]|uniref:phage protein NinX family protein n=1 Tax=Serratia fonticola TaxID=47917 RepID=UPI00164434A8|nr:phage protein NinX family protein [Serratia fonticola]MBC3253531.1 DUF2591 family protein [Serratia fonticola]
MNYSELSNPEINKMVADITGASAPKIEEWGISRSIPDYCNSPDYMWPVIATNKISVVYDEAEAEWCAFGFFLFELGDWDMSIQPEIHHHDINPLRAAAIVFLMMQEHV